MMKPETRKQLDALFAAPLSFYQLASAVVRLLADDDADEVMAALPPEFREEFIAFGREIYLPEGERLVLQGTPTPTEARAAFREWVKRHDRSQARAWSAALNAVVALLDTSGQDAPPAEASHGPPTLNLVDTPARGGALPRQPAWS